MTKQEMNVKLLKLFHDWDDIKIPICGDHVAWGDGYNWYEFNFFTSIPTSALDYIDKHDMCIVSRIGTPKETVVSYREGISVGSSFVEAFALALIEIYKL